MNKRRIGAMGEAAACAFLEKRGYRILARNYQRPTGEIDIIARDGQTLAFIEVKYRASLRYGRPAEAVNAAKRGHLLRTAMLYIAENNLDDAPVRFDVVEVLAGEISLIQNAFDASERY